MRPRPGSEWVHASPLRDVVRAFSSTILRRPQPIREANQTTPTSRAGPPAPLDSARPHGCQDGTCQHVVDGWRFESPRQLQEPQVLRRGRRRARHPDARGLDRGVGGCGCGSFAGVWACWCFSSAGPSGPSRGPPRFPSLRPGPERPGPAHGPAPLAAGRGRRAPTAGASTAIPAASTSRTSRARSSPTRSARTPISGGPSRKPP
jgi:hypothetical protein